MSIVSKMYKPHSQKVYEIVRKTLPHECQVRECKNRYKYPYPLCNYCFKSKKKLIRLTILYNKLFPL